MTEPSETLSLALAHIAAANHLGEALAEQVRAAKICSAMDTLILLRHKQDVIAGLIGRMSHPAPHPTDQDWQDFIGGKWRDDL